MNMKKCPEKELLYRFDDDQLSNAQRAQLESHLQKCPDCRREMVEIKEFEQSLHKQALAAFPRSTIRSRAMKRIQNENPGGEKAVAKGSAFSPWTWVLAPGLAIILIAAMMTSKPRIVRHENIVSCHASAENARVNNHQIPLGQPVALAQFPVSLEGSFIFAVIATETTTFEHSGRSELLSAKIDNIEFRNTCATFTLISGSPISVTVDGEKQVVDVNPVGIGILPIVPKPVVVEYNGVIDASESEGIASLTAVDNEPGPSAIATEPETNVETNGNELPDVVVPASHDAPIQDSNGNPFLDKPLILNGN